MKKREEVQQQYWQTAERFFVGYAEILREVFDHIAIGFAYGYNENTITDTFFVFLINCIPEKAVVMVYHLHYPLLPLGEIN